MRLIIIVAMIVAVLGAGSFLLLRRNTQTQANTANSTSLKTGSSGDMPSSGEVKIARDITITASEYKFSPSEVRVKKGETIRITFKNNGSMPHNWLVENMGGASIDTTSPNGTSVITLTPSQKGTFTTFCGVGNHRKMGMIGTFIVE